MSNSVRIAVTQRIDFIESRSETRDALDQRLVDWIVTLGGIPVPVPNSIISKEKSNTNLLDEWLMAVAPDALVLSGGNDINEYSLRDRTEFALLNWAQARQLPVLGICRGMQLMATWAGATLISIAGHVDTRHELNFIGNQDGLVAGIPREVNSYHNHAVRDCPEGFYVLAKSADAVIEAIAHRQLNWQACMWHPERETVFNLVDINRIRKLFGITS